MTMAAFRWAAGSVVASFGLTLVLLLPAVPPVQIEFPTPTPTPAVPPTPTSTPAPVIPEHPYLGGDQGGFVAFLALLIVYSSLSGIGILPLVAVLVGLVAGLGYPSVWLGWLAAVVNSFRKFLKGG
jgi:hypothetical protein